MLPAAAALAALSASDGERAPESKPGPPAFDDEYDMGPELGSGAFGIVHKAKHKRTGRLVAVKIIRRRPASEDSVRHEVTILQRVGMHRGISCLDAFYETPDAFYLVMEFVEGGELFDKLVSDGAYSEAGAADVLKQVADAVAFLHAQELCHADIKPENLLLTSMKDDGRVKLVDFGLTTELRSAAESKPGTWAYWPPEAFTSKAVTKATDSMRRSPPHRDL